MPDPLRVLVTSPDPEVTRLLESALPSPEFTVASSQPGSSFMQVARRERPQIAIIDRIHERAQAVQMEIAVLRDLCSQVRIIVLSEEPSPADASVVEQGVFYYLAAPSPAKIVAVVHAAAAALRRRDSIKRQPQGGSP